MTNAFKVRMMGVTLGLIAVFSAATWAETPAPADIFEKDAYLDVLPKVEIPDDVQPIPGAVNEEFRNCEASWPAGYALARSGPEARALRDIYSFVRARNVISTTDCGCSGKAANWEGVEAIAAALRERHNIERLGWQQTESVSEEAKQLIVKALTFAPDDPFITDSLGWVEFRMGNLGAALTYLEKAYKDRADAEIAAHLGEVLWKLKRQDEALKVWREGLNTAPNNETLQETVQRLKPAL